MPKPANDKPQVSCTVSNCHACQSDGHAPEPLSREQVEKTLQALDDYALDEGVLTGDLRKHDAAQRARIAALEAARDLNWSYFESEQELTAGLREEIAKLTAQLATVKEERDRLREAGSEVMAYLTQLDQDCQIRPQRHLDMWPWDILQATLRGGPASAISILCAMQSSSQRRSLQTSGIT